MVGSAQRLPREQDPLFFSGHTELRPEGLQALESSSYLYLGLQVPQAEEKGW